MQAGATDAQIAEESKRDPIAILRAWIIENALADEAELVALEEQIKTEIDEAIHRVLDSAYYINGKEVGEFEAASAQYLGVKHAIGCASGTDALQVAMMALNIGPGDEVVTTPFTFVATAEMIVLAGGKPVFVDVEEDTANIDVSRLEAAITPRTRAIMPVSLYGQPGDMDRINAVAAVHGLAVIEDAAQSFGATYKGRKSGNLSTIGCTSFFPSKPLGCYGDGGAIFTSDAALAKAPDQRGIHELRYVRGGQNDDQAVAQLQAVRVQTLEHGRRQRQYHRSQLARFGRCGGIWPDGGIR